MSETPEPTPVVETPAFDREAFFAKAKAEIKSTKVRFRFAGENHTADVIGNGISAAQMAEIDAVAQTEEDASDQMTSLAQAYCRIISDSVKSWSLPVPATYEELNTWPQNLIDHLWNGIVKGGQNVPKDRQAKTTTEPKRA